MDISENTQILLISLCVLPDFSVNCGSILLIFEDLKQCMFPLTMVKNFNKYKTDFKLKCEE